MKKFFFSLIFLGLVFSAGLFVGSRYNEKGTFILEKKGKQVSLKEYPVQQHKNFVIVISSPSNQRWVERNLRSIAEQDYENYRIIYIDNHSTNLSRERVLASVRILGLDGKFVLEQSKEESGPLFTIYQNIHNLRDDEIVVFLKGDDWFSHDKVLSILNREYQNPDVWLTCGTYIDYPSFSKGNLSNFNTKKIGRKGYRSESYPESLPITFYSALFKKIKLSDFFYHGKMLDSSYDAALMFPMLEIAEGKYSFIPDVLYCRNCSDLTKSDFIKERTVVKYLSTLSSYPSSKQIFLPPKEHIIDLIVFSDSKPIQLFAFLESLQKYVSGFYRISVLYNSSEAFEKGYEKVKDTFVGIHFLHVNEKDFKSQLLNTLFDNPADYVLFAREDLIVKSPLDLKECVQAVEETGACGFYFPLGNNLNYCQRLGLQEEAPPHLHLGKSIYAWNFEYGKGDFSYPHSIDLSLFRKEDMKKILSESEYENVSMLEYALSEEMPENMLGLYYDLSKAVRVSLEEGLHFSQAASSLEEELLEKFEEGMKINIDPYVQAQNRSVYSEIPLELIPR